MKYLLILLLVFLAGIEFYHELSAKDASASAICTASDGKEDAVGDALWQHIHSHR